MLAAEIKAGDLSAAQATWLSAHMAWERLGSAYGMFGPYDDEIDGTPFGLPGGVNDPGFTGFYRLEYGLWHGQSAAELTGPAETLNLDVRSLETAYPGMELLPPLALSDLALRTHEVLENAMQQQLSGQDNFGSGTTLATLAAGIDATKTQLSFLHPLLIGRYQDLSALNYWLDRLQSLVERGEDEPRLDAGQQPHHRAARNAGRRRRRDSAVAGPNPAPVRSGPQFMTEPAESTTDPSPPGAQPGRRAFLRAALGSGAVGARASRSVMRSPIPASGRPAAAEQADVSARLPAVPFHGYHQAGILPKPQQQTVVVSFNVTAEGRGELTEPAPDAHGPRPLPDRRRHSSASRHHRAALGFRHPGPNGRAGRADCDRRPRGLAVR